jgi:hypothetical protein
MPAHRQQSKKNAEISDIKKEKKMKQSFHSLYFHSGAEQTKACFAYIRKGRGIVMRHRPEEKNLFFFFGVPLLTR